MKKNDLFGDILQVLNNKKAPVITDNLLFQVVLNLLDAHGFDSDIQTKEKSIRSHLQEFKKERLLLDADFSKGVWRNPNADKGTAAQVACIVDPLCYISHLSAMRIYGFTNRNPKDLILTIPGRKAWHNLINPIDNSLRNGRDIWVKKPHISLPSTLRKKIIKTFRTEHICYPAVTQEDGLSRIVPVGRCFLDMLSEPELCGGMTHVLDVFREHAMVFHKEIIAAAEKDTRASIVKVRLGYIFNEILEYNNPQIENWLPLAQRGGSRKLDPQKLFDGKHISEKWMLSLND